ncbi:hypothetical protein, partial [Enterobacter hormaechei]|uniref:hypothetical protein n=1 Tax=Enterobacter hormaechei TaxID=158836 RepID=UPI0023E43FA8
PKRLCSTYLGCESHQLIFVDDIVFGGKEVLCKGFADKMKHEFEMSMFGEIDREQFHGHPRSNLLLLNLQQRLNTLQKMQQHVKQFG